MEKIDLGVDFPVCLSSAMDRAGVVLAVIGDQCQETLVRNARRRTSKDYVREELKQAGQRIHRGELVLLVPVLIDTGARFDPDAWPPAVRRDLDVLRSANGLRFDDGSWEADFQRLLAKIRDWRQSLPPKTKDRDQRTFEALADLNARLANHVGLQGLSRHWSPDSTTMAQPVSRQLRQLRLALIAWRDSGSLPSQQVSIRPQCMALVANLARLAVDAQAAAAAVQSGQPLPCTFKGTSALVRAVAQDHPLVLLPTIRGYDVRPDRAADASVDLDPGAGLPWVKDLALQFWNALYPAESRLDMTEAEIKALAATLRARTEDDGTPFLVFCPASLGQLDQARTKAQTLNAVPLVWAEPAAGAPAVLYEPETDLVAAMRDCILEIGRL